MRGIRVGSGMRMGYRGGYINRRKEKAEQATPVSTPNCIIFPYNKKTKKFETKDLSSLQPPNRPSIEEVEKFLEIITEPLTLWENQYGDLMRVKGKYFWYLILFILLLPLLPGYLFWLVFSQSDARSNLKPVVEQTRTLISKNSTFGERGFSWAVPERYPQWIELRKMNGVFEKQFIKETPDQQGIDLIKIQPKN